MAKKNRGNDFLNDFLGRKPVDPTHLNKHSVKNDKWDQESYQSIFEEMKELQAAEDRLTDVADTGSSMMADTFFSLVKANPELEDGKKIRPSYLINRAVMGEAMNLKEYDELRSYSVGDEIAAGLACVAMEPDLEALYDQMKQLQELAKQYEQQIAQMAEHQQEDADLDKMIEDALNGDPAQAQNYQEQQSLLQQQMEMLQQQMDQTQQEIAEAMNAAGPQMKSTVKGMLNQAIDQAEQMENLSTAWGLDPGSLKKLPPEQRLEMAKRLNTEKFRRIAKLFGPMHRLAFAEQQRKTIHARDEIYDLELGNDIGNLLPTELLQLRHPALKLQFYRKFFEGELLQYKLRGQERVAKGGIIFNEDGSGSMSGDREIWAKAVGLSLLQIARAQNRPFYGIHFGGPGAMKHFDFRNSREVTVEQVIEFAETFFGGGTDFMGPLSKSLDLLKDEFAAQGAVNGDIVFCTDGQCAVSEPWLEEFKAEQARIGFRVWGIVIGGSAESEPLASICDGRVFGISDLISGEDIRSIFREL